MLKSGPDEIVSRYLAYVARDSGDSGSVDRFPTHPQTTEAPCVKGETAAPRERGRLTGPVRTFPLPPPYSQPSNRSHIGPCCADPRPPRRRPRCAELGVFRRHHRLGIPIPRGGGDKANSKLFPAIDLPCLPSQTISPLVCLSFRRSPPSPRTEPVGDSGGGRLPWRRRRGLPPTADET